MNQSEEAHSIAGCYGSITHKRLFTLLDVSLKGMPKEELSSKLWKHNPKGQTDSQSWNSRQEPTQDLEHPCNLIIENDNNPFVQVSIQLYIKLITISFYLFIPNLRRPTHRHGTFVAHIAHKIKVIILIIGLSGFFLLFSLLDFALV
jgi:hypothetical protein